MKIYRLPKPAREKAKFHDSVANHSNANIRIAADFEQKIPASIRL